MRNGRTATVISRGDLRTDGGQRDAIVSRLRIWANSADTEEVRQKRLKRIHLCWGSNRKTGRKNTFCNANEMLYESGLIVEAAEPQANFDFALTGQPMRHDHRRVLRNRPVPPALPKSNTAP